jgi:monofunctional biosynthetic peptidoglycan transglycosylase
MALRLNLASAARLARIVLLVLAVLVAIPYLVTPLLRFIDPVSTLMLWRWATGKRVEHTFVPLARISPALPLAVLIAEDARFCRHYGVDLRGIRDAIIDAEEGADLRGASTVTQQVAKNVFLWPQRSYLRKALEFPLALWIDLVLPKRRILEIYLNIVEWGPDGQFGAEAGARRAFRKSARELTRPEAALMAAILPNPVRRRADRPSAGVRRLAGIYSGRAASSGFVSECLRPRP